jgi:hypothetical protein
MPRDRRSTSFSASASFLYGHMRSPPSAGPSTELCTAMIALRLASLLWQNTTCSCSVCAMDSKIMDGSPFEFDAGAPRGRCMRREDLDEECAIKY